VSDLKNKYTNKVKINTQIKFKINTQIKFLNFKKKNIVRGGILFLFFFFLKRHKINDHFKNNYLIF